MEKKYWLYLSQREIQKFKHVTTLYVLHYKGLECPISMVLISLQHRHFPLCIHILYVWCVENVWTHKETENPNNKLHKKHKKLHKTSLFIKTILIHVWYRRHDILRHFWVVYVILKITIYCMACLAKTWLCHNPVF